MKLFFRRFRFPLVLLFAFLLTACKPEYRIKTVVEFEDQTSALQAEKEATLTEVQRRLVADYGQSVTMISGAKELYWETPHKDQPVGEMAQLIAYFGSAELGVYELYYAGDQRVRAVLDSLPLERYGAVRGDPKRPAIVATLTDKRNLPELLTALNDHANRASDLTFAAKVPNRFRNPDKLPVMVYALRGKRADGQPFLTNRDIVSTKVEPSIQGGIAVSIALNDAGKNAWTRVTTNAAGNGRRQIALVLNGEVFTAPSVNMPITIGRMQLVGDLNVEMSEHLAKQLLWKPLPLPLRIVAQDVVD